MATLTVYPDAHPETTTVDGWAVHDSASPLTWATIHGGAGTLATASGADITLCKFTSHADSNRWTELRRSILLFDISAIGSPISAATLTLYGNNKSDVLGVAPDINIYESAPATNTDVVAGDFDSLSTTPLSTAITYADWDFDIALATAPNDFVLNADGLALLNEARIGDGIIKLGARNANYDVANIEPSWSASSTSSFGCHSADKGGAHRPKLVVTYGFPSVRPSAGAITRITGIIHNFDPKNPDYRQRYSLTCVLGGISVFAASQWSLSGKARPWPWPWDRWGVLQWRPDRPYGAPGDVRIIPFDGLPGDVRIMPPLPGDPPFPPGVEPYTPPPEGEDGWSEV